MGGRAEFAADFHALHAGPRILVLPNAWDAASAALMADAGARAVATSSAAVAWAHGYPDGDALPVGKLLATLAEMSRVIAAPLTADIEGGYSDDLDTLSEVIAGVIGAGAVGINLEDGRRGPDLHARKIEAARKAADRAGVKLFINARCDVYLKRLAEGEAAFRETVRRAQLYGAAGADGIFAPGAREPELIAALVKAIALPLNVMGWAGVPNASELEALGVRRLSSATGLFRAAFAPLKGAIEAFLKDGDASALAEAGQGVPDLNARFAAAAS
ncbi:MAG TPA: isocitrate lyase/phosphoenolpyruvate mutase family protein [Caulobacteraceae bacterium]